MNKKLAALVASVLVGFLIASEPTIASTIKVWSAGQALTAADINANFAHIHNLMVGGHGARLVDADVSASADIAQSKIHGLVTAVASIPSSGPKAWVYIDANCGSPTCTETLSASVGVASVSHTATGVWLVTWTTPRSDALYAVVVNSMTANTIACNPVTITTTTIGVNCKGTGMTVAADSKWSLVMFDNT